MKTTKQKSFKQEKGLAKRYGGAVTPGSGNGWVKKNDVRTATLSIEAKYTDAKSFSLKQADLHTAERHALVDGRDSVFIISFAGEEWAVIREEEYRSLRDPNPGECHVEIGGQRMTESQFNAARWPLLSAAMAGDTSTVDPNQPMLPGADQW